jgi:2-dehydrotetronate isomerase
MWMGLGTCKSPACWSEPDRGEVNYASIFDLPDEAEYRGWVGCEYRPAGSTEDGLGWLDKWRQGRQTA